MEDVLGATLYSNSYGGQVGVALIYVKKLDRERMVNCLREKHPDYKTSEYGSRLLYSWTAGHHGKKMDLTGTFASDTLIVIGADAEQVKAALDVLDGKKPGLAKDAPLIKGIPRLPFWPPEGSTFPRTTARRPSAPCCKSASRPLPSGRRRTARSPASTSSQPFRKRRRRTSRPLWRGSRRWASFATAIIPAVKKVMDGLKCESKGATFTATFTASTADVEAAVKAVMEQKETNPAGEKEA